MTTNQAAEVLYQIESGVPIPNSYHKNGFSATLRKLKVGESVVLPTKNASGIISSMKKLGSLEGKFVTRTVGDKRTRVWRIPDVA